MASETDSEAKVRWLARQCAIKGLNIHQANALLNALWTADALSASGGCYSAVARRTGVGRRQLYRFLAPWNERTAENDDETLP
jgi:DNA-binding phage protein